MKRDLDIRIAQVDEKMDNFKFWQDRHLNAPLDLESFYGAKFAASMTRS